MPRLYEKKRLYPKRETPFINEFMLEFHKHCPDIWFFKTHGEPMQTRGVPDVLMCFCGVFVGIEFKIMRKGGIPPNPYQEHIRECIMKSGGLAMIIYWDEADGTVGIGSKRFDTKRLAVEHLISVLEAVSSMVAKSIKEHF